MSLQLKENFLEKNASTTKEETSAAQEEMTAEMIVATTEEMTDAVIQTTAEMIASIENRKKAK